ncbi:hypothetical protein [Sulfitobacter sediminilitoris]|nr:hypothetical protein [Sulfitobacter sediminilitoris]
MQTLKKSFSPRTASRIAHTIIDIVLDSLQDGAVMQSKVNRYH